jgi:hypothetical protein
LGSFEDEPDEMRILVGRVARAAGVSAATVYRVAREELRNKPERLPRQQPEPSRAEQIRAVYLADLLDRTEIQGRPGAWEERRRLEPHDAADFAFHLERLAKQLRTPLSITALAWMDPEEARDLLDFAIPAKRQKSGTREEALARGWYHVAPTAAMKNLRKEIDHAIEARRKEIDALQTAPAVASEGLTPWAGEVDGIAGIANAGSLGTGGKLQGSMEKFPSSALRDGPPGNLVADVGAPLGAP